VIGAIGSDRDQELIICIARRVEKKSVAIIMGLWAVKRAMYKVHNVSWRSLSVVRRRLFGCSKYVLNAKVWGIFIIF
jgi:hypothetical protein